jgi:SAM-dependent methyltransferase
MDRYAGREGAALYADIDAANHRAYSSRLAVKAYTDDRGLSIAEQRILERLRPRLTDKKLLDIGVGGGRTTPYLLSLSRDYCAIDYSDKLVRLTKAKFGLDSVYCCDARDMRRFNDQTFDFVMFSFNGIDYIAHEGRLAALREIRRVLRTDGMFLFSSHNRNGLIASASATAGPNTKGFRGRLKRAVKRVLLLPRHRRMRRGQVQCEDYAIINDEGLRYSLLTYYVTPRCQRGQLEMAGFQVEGVYNAEGLSADDDDRSLWIHYLAAK